MYRSPQSIREWRLISGTALAIIFGVYFDASTPLPVEVCDEAAGLSVVGCWRAVPFQIQGIKEYGQLWLSTQRAPLGSLYLVVDTGENRFIRAGSKDWDYSCWCEDDAGRRMPATATYLEKRSLTHETIISKIPYDPVHIMISVPPSHIELRYPRFTLYCNGRLTGEWKIQRIFPGRSGGTSPTTPIDSRVRRSLSSRRPTS